MGRRLALVLGVADYLDEGILAEPATAVNTRHLGDLLRSKAIGNFDDVSCVINPDRAASTSALGNLFSGRELDDLILLHISSRTVRTLDGTLHFLLSDSRLDDADKTAVTADWLARQIARCPCEKVILLIDGFCHRSISSLNAEISASGDNLMPAFGRVLIASEHSAVCVSPVVPTGLGIQSFTEAVCAGIASGDADIDHDGLITVRDLYGYLKQQLVTCTPSQTPLLQTHSFDSGALMIAKSTAHVEARPIVATLPEGLRQLMFSSNGADRARCVGILADLVLSGSEEEVSAARLALHELANDTSRNVQMFARSVLAPWANVAEGGLTLDSSADIAPRMSASTYIFIQDSEVIMPQSSNWVGGDQSGRDLIKQHAGHDMTGVAAGTANAVAASSGQASPYQDLGAFKAALATLLDDVSGADMNVAEKLNGLTALTWWSEHIDDTEQPPDTSLQTNALKKAGGWVWQRFTALMRDLPAAGVAAWVYEIAKGLLVH